MRVDVGRGADHSSSTADSGFFGLKRRLRTFLLARGSATVFAKTRAAEYSPDEMHGSTTRNRSQDGKPFSGSTV